MELQHTGGRQRDALHSNLANAKSNCAQIVIASYYNMTDSSVVAANLPGSFFIGSINTLVGLAMQCQ